VTVPHLALPGGSVAGAESIHAGASVGSGRLAGRGPPAAVGSAKPRCGVHRAGLHSMVPLRRCVTAYAEPSMC
jgi:hypothetical protein